MVFKKGHRNWNLGLNKEDQEKHCKKGKCGNYGDGYYIYDLPKNKLIKERFETILLYKGLRYKDIYKKFNFDKSFASRIINGTVIPKREMRVKIAESLGTDSLVFWRDEDLLPVVRWEECVNPHDGGKNK